MLVTFHGSRNGDKFPLFHNGHGDWAANYDDKAVYGKSELGIQYMAPNVVVHRGFANNFKSSEESLYSNLKHLIPLLKPEWIIVTGHSKGAAVASIAAPAIKTFVRQEGFGPNVKVGAVLFSVPRAFNGPQSRSWVHKTLGKRNIIRINVYGDPVPQVPFKAKGFDSVGILILDSISDVYHRGFAARSQYSANSTLFDRWFNWVCGYHYGSAWRTHSVDPEFDPAVVLPFAELSKGLEVGRQHVQGKKNAAFLNSSFYGQGF
jgi:hypothetical protein